jgi:signal transduction histidine kinase
MKPLKLYTRTTILVSAVLATVLLAVVYFFISRTKEIDLRDQEARAELWARQLATQLSSDSLDLATLRKNVFFFHTAHEGQIQQIRIYGLTRKGLQEEISVPPASPEELLKQDLVLLRQGKVISGMREIGAGSERERVIYAAAPILDEQEAFAGVVSLTIPLVPLSALSWHLMQLTVALLAVAIVSITALLYFLFSQVIYRPVEDLLKTMEAVKSGNLEVKAPVHAHDEFGQLSTVFNHMIARLKAMTEERASYQRDLEERVQEATAELAERNRQLAEASTALFEIQRELTRFERLAVAGQLATQLAHEVGTPLNLISGHVQLLIARTEDQKTRERLDLIASQIARIERIVRNLLDTTRRPQPELVPTDLNALLRRIFEVTAPTLAARQVTLVTSLDPELPLVRGDSEQLQQVFINLINNSLDAMPQGGELSFTTAVVNGEVQVKCRDSGVGISEEIKGRLFDPFFTTKLRGRGSGLGLTVAHQIIREHGGRITLTSEVGQGAEFQISLPLAEPALPATVSIQTAPEEAIIER